MRVFDEMFYKKEKQKLTPWGWAQGPMTSPTKTLKYISFQFFQIETTRLSASFEDLNSSLAQSTGELWLAQTGQIPVVEGSSARCV